MDARTFLDAVAADHETALSRLASSKVLYALTGGAMDDAAVYAATADRASAAADAFAAWAADASDPEAETAFDAAASATRSDAEAIEAAAAAAGVSRPGVGADLPAPGPLFEQLAALEGTVERAAGLAAWTLIEDGVRGQAVGFFVGRADPTAADRYRELRGPVESIQSDAIELLDEVCGDDEDWATARDTADEVVDAAYGQYVELLEGMGIKVKPVC